MTCEEVLSFLRNDAIPVDQYKDAVDHGAHCPTCRAAAQKVVDGLTAGEKFDAMMKDQILLEQPEQ